MTISLYVADTADAVREKIVGYAQVGKLIITNWLTGAVGQQILETVTQLVAAESTVIAQAIRGFASLDTSVDPGDVDPYDATSVDQTPGPGFLSNLGSGTYGTERIDATFATGTITFANTGAGAVQQRIPGVPSLTFQRNYANSDGTTPTYRNSNATAIVVGAGQTVSVPIEAEQAGSAYSAPSTNTITILVNTLPGVTVTNPSPLLGTDRQDADSYRDACREAASLTSPNGPADSYRYLATTGRDDGTWGNSTTGNSLGITGVYVSQDSSSGIVNVYFKGPSGGAGLNGTVPATTGPLVGMTFVQAANYIIAQTPGVIAAPDAMTYTGQAATDVPINVAFVFKIRAGDIGYPPGVYSFTSPPAGLVPLVAAISAAYASYFQGTLIGGDDQDSTGSGVIYTEDFRGILYKISLTPGVYLRAYDAIVTAPSASSTALATGHDAVLGTLNGLIQVV